MNATSLISTLAIPAGIIGALTFFLMAIFAQESKVLSRTTLVRSAFVHVIAFVSLAMVVGSVIYLGQEALRASAFKKAQTPYSYAAQPPMLYFSNVKLSVPTPTPLTCDTTCDISDTDKQQISAWRDSYKNWKENMTGLWPVERKRGMVDALSMLLVGGGLFVWFFIFIAQRENRRLRPVLGKPIALRTVYYYLVALVSLLSTIIATTLLVNIALKSAFGLQSSSKNNITTPASIGNFETASVQSLINCGDTCGISQDDQTLAKEWVTDYDAWLKTSSYQGTSTTQSDLANFIPIFLVTGPLFWYHFARIRREGHEADSTSIKKTT